MPTVHNYYLFTQIYMYISTLAVSSRTKTNLTINLHCRTKKCQKVQWSIVVYEGSLIAVICRLVDSHLCYIVHCAIKASIAVILLNDAYVYIVLSAFHTCYNISIIATKFTCNNSGSAINVLRYYPHVN